MTDRCRFAVPRLRDRIRQQLQDCSAALLIGRLLRALTPSNNPLRFLPVPCCGNKGCEVFFSAGHLAAFSRRGLKSHQMSAEAFGNNADLRGFFLFLSCLRYWCPLVLNQLAECTEQRCEPALAC